MKTSRPTRDPRITSRIMASVPAKNTQPELAVRKQLWILGYRYLVHPPAIVGRPDIAFPRLRIAIFIDGDFWHGNPQEWKRRGLESLEDLFPSRTDWWAAKIRRNIERDREVNRQLRAAGWRVLRYWESLIRSDIDRVIWRIARAVEQRGGRPVKIQPPNPTPKV